MTGPLVSVLIPAHNAEPYLPATLDSIANQTYTEIETILVDDHSTDRTSEIADSYDQSLNIQVVSAKHRGAAAARNQAFSMSNGSFVKYLDADDLLSDNHIEEQIKAIQYKPTALACSAWGRFYNNEPEKAELIPDGSWQSLDPIEWLYLNFELGHKMMQCGMFLISREIIGKSGLWDETLSLIDDFEFYCRVICNSTSVEFTENAVLYYRSDVEDSLSKTRSPKAVDSAIRSLHSGIKSITTKDSSDRIRQMAANIYQSWSYTFYPKNRKASLELEAAAREMGGASIELQGGPITLFLAQIFGWKIAKSISSVLS